MGDRPIPQTSTFTTHKNHQRQTLKHPAIFEPIIPASEKAYTHPRLKRCGHRNRPT